MKIAVLQMNSGEDAENNLSVFSHKVEEAAEAGARLITSPENCLYIGREKRAHLEIPGQSSGLLRCAALAKRWRIYLHLGSCYTGSSETERFHNESFLFGPDGNIAARYKKAHTFDVSFNGREYRESRTIAPGQQLVVCPIEDQGERFTLGFAICYDLRFSGMFSALKKMGADVFLTPANFTRETGALHWHGLARSRALDQGAYVLAAAQCGDNGFCSAYGHALAVDPNGSILAEAGEDPTILYAELSPAAICRQEESFGTVRNRRTELYPG